MRLLKSHSTNAFFNLTSEKYFLDNYKEPIFLLYIHTPSIIVGKNQNTLEEINYEYVKTHKIRVARRLSGGGAVFHDKNNLNFSFITKKDEGNIEEQFIKFTKPIIEFLKCLGANATFSGRNDILIDGKKCSGNAQAYQKDIMLHHGTLLFDSDMSLLTESLKPNKFKMKSKGIDSVRSRVTNIKLHLNKDLTIEQFRDELISFMKQNFTDYYELDFTKDEIEAIEKMSQEKYGTWDYVFGKSPKFQFKNINKFKGGIVECQFDVSKGIIQNMHIYGDFFGLKDINELTNQLNGTKYEESAIKEKLIDLNDYINNITVEEFISLLF
ncbi:lipoate--protein ligase [Mycoplasmatota bacterium]|nr:lipoate--protein ligase [Mycoplasmatota bacterium]